MARLHGGDAVLLPPALRGASSQGHIPIMCRRCSTSSMTRETLPTAVRVMHKQCTGTGAQRHVVADSIRRDNAQGVPHHPSASSYSCAYQKNGLLLYTAMLRDGIAHLAATGLSRTTSNTRRLTKLPRTRVVSCPIGRRL